MDANLSPQSPRQREYGRISPLPTPDRAERPPTLAGERGDVRERRSTWLATWLGHGTLLLASLLGLAAFLYPFFLPVRPAASAALSHSADAPLIFAGLLVLALASMLAEAQPGHGGSRLIVVVAGLVTVNAALRLIPSVLGATPIFVLVILSGYVFGARFGFLVGALSLALSGLLTGGIGPWLPYQMFALGWVGLGARGLAPLAGRRLESIALAAYGGLTGFAFGFLMNLWFWPFLGESGGAAPHQSPGAPLANLQRYLVFYGATSLAFDGSRAIGNVLLLLALGRPLLRVLRRFRRRLTIDYRPPPVTAD